MVITPVDRQRTYLLSTLLSTLFASFIWGASMLLLLGSGVATTATLAASAFLALRMVTRAENAESDPINVR
jgi:hypothetical protein